MSGLTLAIDGSTYAGSIALLRDSSVISERTLVDTGIPSKGGVRSACCRLSPSVWTSVA